MFRMTNILVVLLGATAPLAAPTLAEATLANSQVVDSLSAREGLAVALDSIDEGPHVYWQDDSGATVFYLCRGQVESRVFQAVDTLRFNGLCQDSLIQYVIPAEKPVIEPYVFNDVPQILAVSDIHGEYEVLIELLNNSYVIDDDLHWICGDRHLVVLGDVFDRGDRVTSRSPCGLSIVWSGKLGWQAVECIMCSATTN